MRKCLLAIIIFFSFLSNISAQSRYTAIKAGRMVDVITGKVLKNQVILIENNLIKAVGPSVSIPAGADIIDLSDATVLPGLIDCHTHITFQPGENYYADIFRKTSIDYAVEAHLYAKVTLQAGFTTCRDLGAQDLIDISLRNAINAGTIEGPRLLVSGFAIGSTGGHADLTGFAPNIDFKGNPDYTGVADGPDQIRKRVRNNVKWGADNIKMMATAGVLSEEESVGAPQYSYKEMKALVDEAHMWGKKVAAHAHGTEGIKRAVKAGVNSVEHCSIVDDETLQMMKANGTYMVPTMYALDYIISSYSKKGFPEKILNKAREIHKDKTEGFAKAVRAGVKIAYGTDAGVMPHGLNGKDFVYCVQAGMTPMQAIQSATVNASALLGMKSKIGSITPGKFADIIAVAGDPLKNIAILEQVSFVMKDGIVYKNELR